MLTIIKNITRHFACSIDINNFKNFNFLLEHCYKASAPGAENDRTMHFYDEARVDGLVKRIETPISMTEHYKNRDDFQYYKHIDFGKRTKKFGPQDEVVTNNPRPIVVRKK